MDDGVQDRRSQLSFWLSIFAVVFAGLAAAFTGLQWYESRQHDALSLKPSVDFYTQDQVDIKPVGLAIENHGPGPAIIKSVTYYVNREPVKDADEAMTYGKFNVDFNHGVELEEGDAVGVGEKDWIIDYRANEKKELDRFLDFLDQNLAAEIEYCSLAGECQKICSTRGRC